MQKITTKCVPLLEFVENGDMVTGSFLDQYMKWMGGLYSGKKGWCATTAMDNEIALTLKVYQYLHLGNKMEQRLKRLTGTIPTGGVIAMWKFITP